MVAGTENTLAALIKTEIEARILAQQGFVVATPNVIVQYAESVAFSVIPHFVANVQIGPGGFTAGPDPVVGIGAFL